MLRKMKAYFSLPRAMRRLVWEAYVLLGWARILKAMPFAKIAPGLGTPMVETPMTGLDRSEVIAIRNISRAICSPANIRYGKAAAL